MRKTQSALLIALLAIMTLPAVQMAYAPVKEEPLKGYYSESPVPSPKFFTWSRWFSQKFREKVESGLNDQAGFRNTFIRIANQFDYSFFGLSRTPGFIVGKEGVLFEEDYIFEYTGKYFVGREPIDRMVSRLKVVSDSLAAHDIPLVIVFESGKAGLYPEYIPGRYRPDRRTLTNYDCFTESCRRAGLPVLDLHPWLEKVKDTSRHPLFPKYGMHWSHYGTWLTADTLAGHLAAVTGRAMPRFNVIGFEPNEHPRGSEHDIADMLNLACPLPPAPSVSPVIGFAGMPDGTLPAIIVGDSYYIELVETYGKKLFGRQDFWYYNSSLYPHQNEVPPVRVDKSGLRDKLLSAGVVLLLVSEINMHSLFWHFADEAYLAFHPGAQDSHLDRIASEMRIDREWFRFMVKKAEERKVTLEQVIREDAAYTFLTNYSSLEGKNRTDSIRYLQLQILSDTAWMRAIRQKANDRGIPVETMVILDAEYTYDQTKKNP